MRDILLILLGIALVPLSEHFWDIGTRLYQISRSLWKRRPNTARRYWGVLTMGVKHSLRGSIPALIIVIGIGVWLHFDDVNNTKELEQKNIELINTMNKMNSDLTERLDKLITTMEVQNVSGNSTTPTTK